jgi:hypothetical protein
MKRKIFEKILSIGNVLIALVFVIVLLVTMFGGIDAAEFNNQLVQGLFMSLGVLYLLLAGGTVAYQFIDTDAVKEILISSDKQTSTKASALVIKRLAKKSIATIEGVKCTKVVISLTEYGVRLKLGIKVIDKEIQEVAALLKCLLEDVYYETLGYRFYAIDFKVLSLKSSYTSDMSKIEENAKEEVERQRAIAEQKAKKELENVQNAIDDIENADKKDEISADKDEEISADKDETKEETPAADDEIKSAANKSNKRKPANKDQAKEEVSADKDQSEPADKTEDEA